VWVLAALPVTGEIRAEPAVIDPSALLLKTHLQGIEGLRTASLGNREVSGKFTSCQVSAPDDVPVSTPDCASTLGWRGEGLHGGRYWVEVSHSEDEFWVHGVIVLNGVEYRSLASKEKEAHVVSPAPE